VPKIDDLPQNIETIANGRRLLQPIKRLVERDNIHLAQPQSTELGQNFAREHGREVKMRCATIGITRLKYQVMTHRHLTSVKIFLSLRGADEKPNPIVLVTAVANAFGKKFGAGAITHAVGFFGDPVERGRVVKVRCLPFLADGGQTDCRCRKDHPLAVAQPLRVIRRSEQRSRFLGGVPRVKCRIGHYWRRAWGKSEISCIRV
jgi:hypothetical protein